MEGRTSERGVLRKGVGVKAGRRLVDTREVRGDDGKRETAVVAHGFEVELNPEGVNEGAVIGDV
jgi:hypothetical protein